MFIYFLYKDKKIIDDVIKESIKSNVVYLVENATEESNFNEVLKIYNNYK